MTIAAQQYVDRWDNIRSVVKDERMIQAMWNAPDERRKREEILKAADGGLLSRALSAQKSLNNLER